MMGRSERAASRVSALARIACAAIALATLAGGARALTGSPGNPPTIASDKADYAPGSTVRLTGANWQPGELVHIFVNDDAGQTWSHSADVTAAGDGTIDDQFQLPDWFVATYTATATGPASGTATTTFTDGNVDITNDASTPAGVGATFKLENLATSACNATGTFSSQSATLI